MDYKTFSEKIKQQFKKYLAFDLDESKCQMFFDYMNLLIEKNKVMNLTAITEPDEIIVRHFVDSCSPILFSNLNSSISASERVEKYFDFKNKYCIDVGTGAGFPGLPLAIVLSETNFLLTDTLGKRINFLSEVCDAIKIKNVNLIKARAEDLAHDKNYREKFDFAFSRGVAKIPTLMEYTLPFIKIGGSTLCYKMNDIQKELDDGKKAINVLGGMFHVKHSYELIDAEPERCIIDIKKVKSTPKQYPRKAGVPSREPI